MSGNAVPSSVLPGTGFGLFRAAYAGLCQLHTEQTAESVVGLCRLAVALVRVGKYQDAEEVLEKAVNFSVGLCGENHIQTVKLLFNLSHVSGLRGRGERRAVHLRRALSAALRFASTDATVAAQIEATPFVMFALSVDEFAK